MARFKMRMKGGDPGQITRSIVRVLLLLWIGGLIVWQVGITMLGSCSPFFKGLSLIGWKTGTNATASVNTTFMCQQYNRDYSAGMALCDNGGAIETSCGTSGSILYDSSGTGILVIVGLVSIAYVAMKFIKFTKF